MAVVLPRPSAARRDARGAPRARRRGGARAGSPRSSARTCRSSCRDDTAAARLHDRSLCGVHKAGSLDGMAWRLTGFVGALASAAFAAGIAHVYLERPDPAMGVWDALQNPYYLRPYSPNARVLFACLAIGGGLSGGGAAASDARTPRPAVADRLAGGRRQQPSRWWGRGWTCTAIRPNHRACYLVRSYDPATGAHRVYTLCQTEPNKLLGRTVGRALSARQVCSCSSRSSACRCSLARIAAARTRPDFAREAPGSGHRGSTYGGG